MEQEELKNKYKYVEEYIEDIDKRLKVFKYNIFFSFSLLIILGILWFTMDFEPDAFLIVALVFAFSFVSQTTICIIFICKFNKIKQLDVNDLIRTKNYIAYVKEKEKNND